MISKPFDISVLLRSAQSHRPCCCSQIHAEEQQLGNRVQKLTM